MCECLCVFPFMFYVFCVSSALNKHDDDDDYDNQPPRLTQPGHPSKGKGKWSLREENGEL